MRTHALVASALITLTVLKVHAEATTPADGTMAEAKRSGFTVAVEFYVDSSGAVTNAKVLRSDALALNDFALAAVQTGKLNPQPLPAPGSEPKRVSSELFYPVDDYDSGKPLPVGMIMPAPKFQTCPVFPFEYRRKGITGGALVSMTVGKAGNVIDCKVIKASHPGFGSAAEQAVRKWVFKPATVNGKPVEVTLNVPISFQIDGHTHGWRWLVAPPPSLSGYTVTTNGP